MREKQRLKVLIVDDSRVYREVLVRGLSSDPDLHIVGTAVDPFDARDKLLELRPDVMICDIQMPKMDGIEFLKRLLPQYSLPVIVVSTVSTAVFDALQAGAVDFVCKPDVQSAFGVEQFLLQLIHKVKIAAQAKVSAAEDLPETKASPSGSFQMGQVIVLGASTGGTEAIASILSRLPAAMPGIVIVQHIPPLFSKMFADRLHVSTGFSVKEAQTGDLVEPGKVLIAPGDRHLRIRKSGTALQVECFEGERVNGHCPSIDVLFDSAAKICGSSAIGVLLTGMGYDGARGLLAMRRKGARTIGQDEPSSTVYGMPKAAYEIGAVEKQTSLERLPHILCSMLK
ncbi:chemotaxis response regulator protein-glutamate methylesterase [Paenibacillus nanensis]|uniref:Protein-glutamate methylesterase/protein-glutamine glutaminase n=1 Tax=Paenibacillus nanensis TaxID=393251 RepID=A0A3A1UYV9_9BACL|nr:chemotaxis response regulator protein-glutamate methylesterase [Paenibacillus nanensis]RIX53687.1 chemotaxis response regulator protein-glutamate methylesterase [Paenibacillus nanensis]